MVRNVVLRLPAEAARKRQTRIDFPVILEKESAVENVGRVAGAAQPSTLRFTKSSAEACSGSGPAPAAFSASM